MAYEVDIRSDVDKAIAKVTRLTTKELYVAIADGLTALAVEVQQAEKRSLPITFKAPTPFTMNSIRIIPANRNLWQSEVFVMDKIAEYLYPYEVGGLHKLIGRGVTWLEPGDYSLLNQYGNFPQNKLKQLKAKKAVFIGAVKTRKGPINGVWMRTNAWTGKASAKGRGLKLLIKFGDAHPAKQHLDFHKRGEQVVQKMAPKVLGAAIGRAIARSGL